MKLLRTLTVIGALGLAPMAYATTPSDTSLNQLAELMPYEAVFAEAVFAPLEMEGQALAYSLQNDTSLSDTQRQDALKAFDDYAKGLVKELGTPAKKAELKKAYIAAAKASYTQEEVDALTAFYSNKVAQSALAKSDTVLSTYMQSINDATTKTISSYEQKHLTTFQDKVKRILDK